MGEYSLSAWAGESGWNRCSEIQIGDDCAHSVDAALAAKGCGTLYDVQTDDDDMVCVEVCAITKGSVFSGLLYTFAAGLLSHTQLAIYTTRCGTQTGNKYIQA